MGIYFENLEQFKAQGGLKQTTITAKQLLPAIVAHMQRMDRTFALQLNGRLPKSIDELLEEAFALCHLQQPFYTQHCANRSMKYKAVSKNRIKIDFTLTYRMTREQEKWIISQIEQTLKHLIAPNMTTFEKIVVVHEYIVRTYDYELNTNGSPFTVYTFMQEKKAVCMAYALLFQKMMELLNISCYYVVGHADGEGDAGHAWNMVLLDGEWYHIDSTWNDIGTRIKGHEIRYRYFLRTDEQMKRDHSWNYTHYPPCTSTKYNTLHYLYDVTYLEGKLYFPHPKKQTLCSMDCKTLKMEQIAQQQLLYLVAHDKQIYGIDQATKTLTRFEATSNLYTSLDIMNVQRIHVQYPNLVIELEEQQSIVIEGEKMEDVTEQMDRSTYVVVPLQRYGMSWFGSYEGKLSKVLFECADGLQVYINDELKKIAIDILIDQQITVQLTQRRKSITLANEAQVIVPVGLTDQSVKLEKSYSFKESSVLKE